MGSDDIPEEGFIIEETTTFVVNNSNHRSWVMIAGAIILAILLAALAFFAFTAFKARRANEALTKENNRLTSINNTLASEKAQLTQANEVLLKEKAQLVQMNETLLAENKELAEANEALTEQAEKQAVEKGKLSRKLLTTRLDCNMIGEGEGYWNKVSDYVKANLIALGYSGNLNDKEAVERFVNKTTLRSLIANGIMNPKTGEEIRIKEANRNSMLITHDNKRHLTLILYSKDANGDWKEAADDILSGIPGSPADFKAAVKSGSGALQDYEYVTQTKMIERNLVSSCP